MVFLHILLGFYSVEVTLTELPYAEIREEKCQASLLSAFSESLS